MKILKDVFYTKENDLRRSLDIYLPDCEEFPVFIYFHGGGLVNGSKDMGEIIPKEITDRGICFVSAEYRMYPDASYPDFIKDAAAASAWVYNNMSKYGKPTNFYIGGSSAGGYLSMMLCYDNKYLGLHNLKPLDFKGYILDAGQPTAHFNVLKERGIDSRRVIIDESAPLYHICEKEYPYMLIIVSDNDMQNRLEQTMLLASTLKHFNVPDYKYELMIMKNSTHCSYLNITDENRKNVFASVTSEFIKKTENK